MSLRSRRGGWVLLACASVAIPLCACGALIGVKDIFDAPDGSSSSEGGPGGDASSTDGGTSDSGPCGDVMTNGANCGRCGHSCLGGGCEAGQCQPFTIQDQISPRDIVLDKDHVYWIEPVSFTVKQANKDGTNIISLAVGGANNDNLVIGLAVDESYVYWGNLNEYVFRCKIGGCANNPTTVSATGPGLTSIAVDGTNVYWLEGDDSASYVMKTPKGASMDGGTPIFNSPDAGYERMTTDQQFLYWTADDGIVRKIASDGGALSALGSSPGSPVAIVVDDAKVYWADFDDPGSLYSAPKSAGSTTTLVAGQHTPLSLAVDANHLYWVTLGVGLSGQTGTVMTCPFTSCSAPVAIATNLKSPIAIAVDDTAIYWSNYNDGNGGGSVMRLAKP